MDTLLAKLSEQQALLEKQKITVSSTENTTSPHSKDDSVSDTAPVSPVTNTGGATPDTDEDNGGKTAELDPSEVLRLKKELDAAKDKIARQEQELSQTRVIKHTLDQAIGSAAEPEPASKPCGTDRNINNINDAFNTQTRLNGGRQDLWGLQDDTRSDVSDAQSASTFNRARDIWSATTNPGFSLGLPANVNQQFSNPNSGWGQGTTRSWMNRPMPQMMPSLVLPQQQQQMPQRNYSGPSSPISGTNSSLINDFSRFQGGQGLRRSNTQSGRGGSIFTQPRNGWDLYGNSNNSMDGMSSVSSFPAMGMFQAQAPYQPRPIGTPLSPTAAEFNIGNISTNPWNSAVSRACFMVLIKAELLIATIISWSDIRVSIRASQLSPAA